MATIRILSHQACTGGTIISRVVASAPDVVLLSEISPAGPLQPVRFDPLVPLTQFAELYPDLAPEAYLRGDFFAGQMRAILAACEAAGKALVVREHAHSEAFFRHDGRRHTFAATAAALGDTVTVVTVRHPAASFLSLCRAFPDAFDVDFATYCARTLAWLDAAAPAHVETYEAFCEAPFAAAGRMFRAWGMAATEIPDRQKWLDIVRTGDSGRLGRARKIRPAPLEGVDTAALTDAIRGIGAYRTLCERLGYDPDVTAYAQALRRRAALWDFTVLDSAGDPD